MNIWLKSLIAIAVLAAVGVYGHSLGDDDGYARGHGEMLEVRRGWDADKLVWQRTSLDALTDSFSAHLMVEAKNERITRDKEKTIAQLRADAAGLQSQLAGLHNDTASYIAAAARGGQSGLGPSSAQLSAAVRTLGELFDACSARYGELAVEADLSYAAGVECEQRYDALTPK